MVFRSTGIVELGEDLNLSPIERDIVPIPIPEEIPPDGVVLLENIEIGTAPCISDAPGYQPGVYNYDYGTYEPFPGNVVFTYTGDDITKITTTNEFGVKISDLTYVGGEVTQIDIDNYGVAQRRVTFVKAGDVITQVIITKI